MSLQELGHYRNVIMLKALERITFQQHFVFKRNFSYTSHWILTRSASNRYFVHTVYMTFALLRCYIA